MQRTSVTSEERRALKLLRDRYITSDMNIPVMCSETAKVLDGVEEGAVFTEVTKWMEASEASKNAGEQLPEFPPNIVVVTAKQKPKSTKSAASSGSSKKPANTAEKPSKGKEREREKAANSSKEVGQGGGKGKGKGKGQGENKSKGKAAAGKGKTRQTAEEGSGRRSRDHARKPQDDDGDGNSDDYDNDNDNDDDDENGEDRRNRKSQDDGSESEDSDSTEPVAGYNDAIEFVDSDEEDRLGDSPTTALPEDQLSKFSAETPTLKADELPIRAATNFRFVNKDGRDISIGPGPGAPDAYLLAACGSLDMSTEGGQRLVAGWWHSDPSAKRRKWKVPPAEVVWMKIPVVYATTESTLHLREEVRSYVTVEGCRGLYVLQCPEPSYKQRWDACVQHFPEKPIFQGVQIDGPPPHWFDPVFWEDLKDEFGRWRKLQQEIAPPGPEALTSQKSRVLKLEAYVAAHEARLREYAEDLKKHQSELADLEAVSHERKAKNGQKSRKPVAEKKRLARIRVLEQELPDLKVQVEAQSQKVEQARQKLASATKAALKTHAPIRPKHRAPIQSPSPEPAPSRRSSTLASSSRPTAGPSAPLAAAHFHPQIGNIHDRSDVLALDEVSAMQISDEMQLSDDETGALDAQVRMTMLGYTASAALPGGSHQ